MVTFTEEILNGKFHFLCSEKGGKLYSRYKKLGLETGKGIFKVSKIFVQEMQDRKEGSYFEEKLVQNSKYPKELRKSLKTFGSNVKEGNKAKVSPNKYGTIQFETREKTKIPKASIPN